MNPVRLFYIYIFWSIFCMYFLQLLPSTLLFKKGV